MTTEIGKHKSSKLSNNLTNRDYWKQ